MTAHTFFSYGYTFEIPLLRQIQSILLATNIRMKAITLKIQRQFTKLHV